MILCKDCKHYDPKPLGKPAKNFDRCKRALLPSPVDGVLRYTETWHKYCEIERTMEGYLFCGPSAQFFEAREEELSCRCPSHHEHGPGGAAECSICLATKDAQSGPSL